MSPVSSFKYLVSFLRNFTHPLCNFAMPMLLFMTSCSQKESITKNHETVVGILPFENFPKEKLPAISEAIQQEYGYHVVVLESTPIPQRFFINLKLPRYRADSIIQYVRKIKPDSVDLILSLTTRDISMTKRNRDGSIKEPKSKYADWGVFGLGYLPGESSVVSTFRIDKSATFDTRLRKISLHEVGHNLGLPHCPDPSCFMVDAAESISTIDKAGEHLCAACRKKLE
jgi:archaemetzincin